MTASNSHFLVVRWGDEEEEWCDQPSGGEDQSDHCHHEAAGAKVRQTVCEGTTHSSAKITLPHMSPHASSRSNQALYSVYETLFLYPMLLWQNKVLLPVMITKLCKKNKLRKKNLIKKKPIYLSRANDLAEFVVFLYIACLVRVLCGLACRCAEENWEGHTCGKKGF